MEGWARVVGGRRAVKELRAQGALMRLEHRTDKAARRAAGSEVRARQRALAGSVKALASSIGPPPRGAALHRYERVQFTNLTAEDASDAAGMLEVPPSVWGAKVGWCNLERTTIDSAWFPRMSLQYDELPPSFAFDFNLRPYAKAFAAADTSGRGKIDEKELKVALVALGMDEVSDAEMAAVFHAADAERGGGGLVGVKEFTAAAVALSERREKTVATQMAEGVDSRGAGAMVGRCRLTVSNAVLKAPMIAALEATI